MLRGFAYLYHAVLCLFLLALALVAISSRQELHLEMVPWHGTALTYVLLIASIAGLVSLVLALRRTWRGLFFLWTLVVLAMMVRGFFFSSYHFDGHPSLYRALLLILGAILAAFGAWLKAWQPPERPVFT